MVEKFPAFLGSRSYFIISQFSPVHLFTPTFQRSFPQFRSIPPPGPFIWYFLANILYAVLPSCCMMGVIPVSTLVGVSRQNQSFSSAPNASDFTQPRVCHHSVSGCRQCPSSVGQEFGLPAVVNRPVTFDSRSCVWLQSCSSFVV